MGYFSGSGVQSNLLRLLVVGTTALVASPSVTTPTPDLTPAARTSSPVGGRSPLRGADAASGAATASSTIDFARSGNPIPDDEPGRSVATAWSRQRLSDSRVIEFSNLRWFVKDSDTLVGPGPNLFSASPEGVWTDAQGHLHLRFVRADGDRWASAEVLTTASAFGYGEYQFYVRARAQALHPATVFGMFVMSDAPEHHHREMDVEISRWGIPGGKTGQFAVQPHTDPKNVDAFDLPETPLTLHTFRWTPDEVLFRSYQGHSSGSTPIREWSYQQAIPKGAVRVRLNLWLFFQGGTPTEAQEVVVERFNFIPLP